MLGHAHNSASRKKGHGKMAQGGGKAGKRFLNISRYDIDIIASTNA